MDTITIRYFIALSQNLSFTQTAKEFYTSQQNISQHIKKLEQFYEANLFIRKPRLELSPEGHSIYNSLRQLITAEDNSLAIISDLKKNNVGTLTIGTSPYRGMFWIPKVVPSFLKKWPNVQVKIVNDKTNNLEKRLLEGELDLIVGLDISSNQHLQSHPLIDDRLFLVVTPKIIQSYLTLNDQKVIEKWKEGIRINQVSSLPFIKLTSNTKLRKQIDSIFENANISPKTVLEVDNIELMLSLIPQDLGAFFCTGLRVGELKEKYPFAHFFPVIDNDINVYSSLNLSYLKERYHSNYFKDFLTILNHFFKDC